MTTVTFKLRDLSVHEVSLVPKGANAKKFFITKAAPSEESTVADEKNPEVAAAEEAVTKALNEAKALSEQIAKMVAENEAARAEIASIKKAADEAQEEKVRLEKALAEEIEAKAVREAVVKAADDFAHLPVKAEDIAKALHEARKAAPAAVEAIEAVLKAADAALAKGVPTEPIGKSTESKAASKKERLTEAVAKKMAEDPKLSEDRAVVLVLNDNPDLYDG
jgi:regulator of replication initiation timing